MKSPEHKKHFRVVCAVILHNGLVFMGRRKSGVHAGYWEFPGGKIMQDETERDALSREIREELGITPDIGNRLPPVFHVYSDFSIELIPFVCRIDGSTIQAADHDEIRWIDPQRGVSEDMPVLPPDEAILNQVQLRLHSQG